MWRISMNASRHWSSLRICCGYIRMPTWKFGQMQLRKRRWQSIVSRGLAHFFFPTLLYCRSWQLPEQSLLSKVINQQMRNPMGKSNVINGCMYTSVFIYCIQHFRIFYVLHAIWVYISIEMCKVLGNQDSLFLSFFVLLPVHKRIFARGYHLHFWCLLLKLRIYTVFATSS